MIKALKLIYGGVQTGLVGESDKAMFLVSMHMIDHVIIDGVEHETCGVAWKAGADKPYVEVYYE